jgi:hypothetical protein
MNRHTIDYPKEALIEIAVKEWVLEWVRKYNPEVFDRARQFILEKSKHEGVS